MPILNSTAQDFSDIDCLCSGKLEGFSNKLDFLAA